MQCIIKINGHEYPFPRRGLTLSIDTLIDTAVNANGVVVGQKVAGRKNVNDLQWDLLSAKTWAAILKEFKGFSADLTYPDMENAGAWVTRTVIPGERSATPWHLDKETGLPADYRDCRITITDTGA